MINNPENGHNPEVLNKEADPARDHQKATLVAEPGEHTIQTSPSTPGMSPPTVTPMIEGAPAEPLPEATKPVSETDFSSELTKFRQSFEDIQTGFIGEPRAAVEKAETLIDGLMNSLRDELQRIHGKVKTETDTEQLRVAMLSYRELFGSLGGRRAV